MHWSASATQPSVGERLWGIEEAEALPDGINAVRIGWVQVGLPSKGINRKKTLPIKVSGFAPLGEDRHNIVDPARVLPALTQCFHDALCRFGVVKLSGLQARISEPEFHTQARSNLVSTLNWFNLTPQDRTEAIIAFNHEVLANRTTAALVTSLQKLNIERQFAFGPEIIVPESYWINTVPEERSASLVPAKPGIAVTLPEWTASATGWALAIVLDTVRTLTPAIQHCAVRVTRI